MKNHLFTAFSFRRMGAWFLACGVLCSCMYPTTARSQTKTGFEKWKSEHQSLLEDPSVMAYYDFEEGSGTTLKNKSKAGTALNGDIQEAQWAQGRWPSKKALAFDGVSSFVEIPSHKNLLPLDARNGGTGEMTIEVWFKALYFKCLPILDKSSGGSGETAPYSLWNNTGRLCAYLGRMPDKKTIVFVDDEMLDKDTWTHGALTIRGDRATLYKDGRSCGTEKLTGLPSDNEEPLFIAAMGRKSKRFKGSVDEVVIYNRALSEADIERRASLRPDMAEAASLSLTAPRGGERMIAGSKQCVAWMGALLDERDTVRIELSTDDGRSWKELCAETPNTGTFVWEVPASTGNACVVRLTEKKRGLVAKNARPFAIVAAASARSYRWEKVTLEAAFAPRDGPGALVFNGRMWLIGGWNPNDKPHFPRICNNEVWSSADGETWKLEKPNTFLDSTFDKEKDWEGRHTAGYVVHQNKMWIVGGDANQGHYMDDVWNSSDGKTWALANKGKPVPWGPRVLHYTLAFKNKIWVMGGQDMPAFIEGDDVERFYRDIWTTTDGAVWEQVIPKEPYWPARGMIGGNVVFKDRIWIMGGGTYDTPTTPRRKVYHDVWSSADGINWECHVEHAPWVPRQYVDVAVFDGCMWVLEGAGPAKKMANRNDVWYSEDGANWYELPGTPWGARHAAGVFVHDNALWMVAGNNMTPDVWRLIRVK